MPDFNGRGPRGEGPRTGRGRGRCRDNSAIQGQRTEEQEKNKDEIIGRGRGGKPRGGGGFLTHWDRWFRGGGRNRNSGN